MQFNPHPAPLRERPDTGRAGVNRSGREGRLGGDSDEKPNLVTQECLPLFKQRRHTGSGQMRQRVATNYCLCNNQLQQNPNICHLKSFFNITQDYLERK